MSAIKINVCRIGDSWYGARWIDGLYDGCDELDVDDDASDGEALEAARTMPLIISGEREIRRVGDVDEDGWPQ